MGEIKPNTAYLGMNLDSVIAEVKPGQVTFALNAQVSGFDGNSITYQNEQADEFCFNVPTGYKVIGSHNIIELETVIYFLANPTTGDSEIGKVVNDSCVYERVINAKCLNFSIENPILKAVHKITACTVEVYWTDGFNLRRWIDLLNLPFAQTVQGNGSDPCDVVTTTAIDCNKLNVQPDFNIPDITYTVVTSDGNLIAGDYQFAIQYSNGLGDPYTSYYSVTNPISINDYFRVTPDFNYPTSKSIQIEITNIDTTGLYDYFNLAVVKTINNISSVDLVGTFQIQGNTTRVLYTGQSKANITLSINDVFEKFPTFDTAGDLTTVQDVLVWDDLTTTERISYQQIANKIHLQWVNYVLPPVEKGYANPINTGEFRGYLRDEVYAYDMVILLKNGYQSDRFPIPGRSALATDLIIVNNGDTNFSSSICDTPEGVPRWQVYNTATISGTDKSYDPTDSCYQGPYQFGEFSYWESTDVYPCNEAVWGDLAGKPIRHHKFPDATVTHHHDAAGNIYPLGVRVDMQQIYTLIGESGLTSEQISRIAQIKIVRGDRAFSKSIQAKGLFFNVGKYTKQSSTYFYPNYPFNDLNPDPFIKTGLDAQLGNIIISNFDEVSSLGDQLTPLYNTDIPANQFTQVGDTITAEYSGLFSSNGSNKQISLAVGGVVVFHQQTTATSGTVWNLTSVISYEGGTNFKITTRLSLTGASTQTFSGTYNATGLDPFSTINLTVFGVSFVTGIPPTPPMIGDILGESEQIGFQQSSLVQTLNSPLNGFGTDDSKERFTFHSPDTSFYQPFLGNIIKLDSVEYGNTLSHFVQVKDHSKYKFPSLSSYLTSLAIGVVIGFASATVGVSDNVFNGTAAFTAFTVFNDIIYKLIPNRNFAYTFNSTGNYNQSSVILNDTGNKVRQTDIQAYIIAGYQGVGDTNVINNYQRESSVYLRSISTLPFPNSIPGVPTDNSRYTLSQVGCDTSNQVRNISAYYGSIKSVAPDQYGQIYSYPTVDTGFQAIVDLTQTFDSSNRFKDVFGGDTFINRFALKRKYPYFLDNRVNYPDNSDVFYDELGNIGYPTYWFSTDVQQSSGGRFGLGILFGVKVNNFDCKDGNFFYNSGKIYLFAYGIVDFFVESSVNVDYRQAYNSREGDYYPHISGGIPDDWLQEINVSIAQDNSYTYNKTFSKQNTENIFTTLPVDFIPGQQCVNNYPNKAIYSDRQEDPIQYKKNNWLIYRPVSYYDFPLNYGKLISLEGIDNRAVLARFENKSMVYNALLTVQTSNPQAAYIGNDTLFKSSPPIDLAETDLGYAGSQNKFFLKTEYGNVTTDAKRGNIFILSGNRPKDIGDEGLKQFLTDNLPFQILNQFPNYNTDNNFKGVGLHGVYDNKYDRFLLTKLDYICLNPAIVYDSVNDKFTLNGVTVELTDTTYFCPNSFTLSYWFTTNSWISFHSYLPNYYVGATSKFYAGTNTGIPSIWRHNTVIGKYNSFFGQTVPYILEYPYAFKFQDEIIQSVSDYTKVNKITSRNTFVQTNENYFNKAIVYNDQQCSGILNLIPKPQNNLSAYLQYPIYRSNSKDILYTKSDNFYNYNGFWDVVADYNQPIWSENCSTIYADKILNQANMDYTTRSFKKYQIRAKDCKIRHILDNDSTIRLTSQFIATDTQISYK